MYIEWRDCVNPWGFAKLLFDPEVGPRGGLERLSDWRARLGAVVTVYVSLSYIDFHHALSNLIKGFFLSLLYGAFVAIPVLLIFWLAHSGPEYVVKRGLAMVSLKRASGSMLAVAAIGIFNFTVAHIPAIGFILSIWILIFLFSMMWYCIRWIYGIGEVDRLLAPAVSAAIALFAVTVNVVQSGLPDRVETSINLWGLGTVWLLALTEVLFILRHRRRDRHLPH
jgi:hypothetical protein